MYSVSNDHYALMYNSKKGRVGTYNYSDEKYVKTHLMK